MNLRNTLLTLGLLASNLAAEQFTILIYETKADIAARTDAAKAASYWNAFAAFGKQMQDAGILRGGAPFRTGMDTKTVQIRAGKRVVKDGEHVKSNDALGGYFVIDVASLEQAIERAAKVPAASTAAVEVRPSFPLPAMPKP